ncbi:MAG: hypothetical protein Q8O12_00870 [Candidatus Omnitrophota bacterium]|nr:hypothetical protein [Candidatus Omnitrophota bacterium]
MDDIRPLKDIVDIKAGFPVLLVAILVIIALIIAVFIYFKKKKKPEEKIPTALKPAEDIAKDALKALRAMNLVEKGLIKEYYIRLSDIIRLYIENRYRIFAMDRTTWELFQEMKSRDIKRQHAEEINSFLEDCDMVKFAKYKPGEKEIEDIYKKAEEIVDLTTPKIVS